jgi:hypothetical protein
MNPAKIMVDLYWACLFGLMCGLSGFLFGYFVAVTYRQRRGRRKHRDDFNQLRWPRVEAAKMTKFAGWCDRKGLVPTMENADKFAEELVRESTARLAGVLKVYEHCRHACIDCFCTKEARAAAYDGAQEVKA